MMLRELILSVTCVSAMQLGAEASIFANPITDPSPSASNPFTSGQTFDANITVSGIGRGAGLSPNPAANRYNATSWSLSGIDLLDYFEWTLTPNAGFQIDLGDFQYTGQASGSGPSSFAFRSSLDSFGSDIGSPTASGTTIALNAAVYQDIASSITFRLYGFGASNVNGTFSINDFEFNGVVASATGPTPAVPEAPALITWGLLAATFSCAFRFRRKV
jgi:hypothetical protein